MSCSHVNTLSRFTLKHVTHIYLIKRQPLRFDNHIKLYLDFSSIWIIVQSRNTKDASWIWILGKCECHLRNSLSLSCLFSFFLFHSLLQYLHATLTISAGCILCPICKLSICMEYPDDLLQNVQNKCTTQM